LAAASAAFATLAPPGAAVAIVSGYSGETQSFGVEDLARRTPASIATIFQIASLTKPFTAMIVLMLVEEGRIARDEPAAERLRWLPTLYGGVTIRQLLSHVSGVPTDLRRENVDEFGIDEFRRRFAAAEPRFAPGARWEYSNAGYTLLALIAEQAGGAPFDRLLRRRIFRPLGMRSSAYRAPLVVRPGRATGYDWQQEGWRAAPPVYSGWGNSGVETSIADLARFMGALQRTRLLRSASYEQMLAPARLADGTPVSFPFRGNQASYGFGWFLAERCGAREVFHGGTIAGFSSTLRWSRFHDKAVAVLCNGKSGPDRIGIADKIGEAAFTAALPCPAER
jgi:CubicO group peptidase (beta-lactamase class C family)